MMGPSTRVHVHRERRQGCKRLYGGEANDFPENERWTQAWRSAASSWELVQLSLAASRVTGVNRYERFFDRRPELLHGLLWGDSECGWHHGRTM